MTRARSVTHFPMLSAAERDRLFHRPPRPVPLDGPRELVAAALGGTLYIPAVRPELTATVLRAARAGTTSIVLDLEDAVRDDEVSAGMAAVVATLGDLAEVPDAPMVFVRVRSREQIVELLAHGDGLGMTGIVLPKFGTGDGADLLDLIATAPSLYAMPIIESTRVLHSETRAEELAGIADVLAVHRERVLAVRIGATDLSGAFGIRRDPDLTIYDVHPVASVIASVVNVLGRHDGTGFTITGPVWEYYNAHERMFRPQLRNTPFEELDAVRFRRHLVSRDLDGMLREIVLDRANGLQGKTVIHPTHVNVVHATSTVSHEEYVDALAVLGRDDGDTRTDLSAQDGPEGGVLASSYRNKMNERRPHRNWAHRTLLRAEAFGVTRPDVGVIEVLTAVVDR
ncbi:HpcH/HpaI aldolase/citrate lyase family protein [Williamsia deligens]|uniref:HpcH/HpaI aldolase/citrate lyase family protein n=1 Tax=Williamsia deligens TaxID=321325 RepID=A0ABW3GF55_9NOCA|nr:HpcH/HpaI aldolase/citrate lyase family protein [Williamsia deligens]MCP2195179.1 Citrate lyase beta subunit [Williamsia deligens]